MGDPRFDGWHELLEQIREHARSCYRCEQLMDCATGELRDIQLHMETCGPQPKHWRQQEGGL